LQEAEIILTALEAKVQKEFGHPLPAPEAALPFPAIGAFRDMWVAPYRARSIMLMVFHVCQAVGYYGWANWVPTLLIQKGVAITTSLLYTSVIALAAPLGPLLGLWAADRFERKTVIVAMAGLNVACGLAFSQASTMVALILLGVCLTVAGNVASFTYHAYQAELFPTRIRARAVGFVYSWSRFSGIFTAFLISFMLGNFGVTGVFVFIAMAMGGVMVIIGAVGPRTRLLSLEQVSR
jgi:putative MFS transporter